jgi:hypothetical protein
MTDLLINKGGGDETVKKFLYSLLEPLQTITDELKTFETNELKRAKWNGQKMVLQAALNDIFGITSAPFIIVETVPSVFVYFYEASEATPVHFYEQVESSAVFFYEDSELLTVSFRVLIPSGIHTAELERQVRAQTNLYKLAGKTFDIETY